MILFKNWFLFTQLRFSVVLRQKTENINDFFKGTNKDEKIDFLLAEKKQKMHDELAQSLLKERLQKFG